MPADAAALVRSGRLDDKLFNVTGLVRQGYDDARTPNIPLLVKSSAPPAGVGRVARTLPALGITALEELKSDTSRFWRELAGGRQRAAGVEKVWLNARVHASLDESVPRIGTPAAWQAGLTGQGVRVAVLDTGIDTDHPDLAGKVSDSKDFSGKGSVEDGDGARHARGLDDHRVGRGVERQIPRRGPDATLAVGKVLDDNGDGTLDGVLAGMEWGRGRPIGLPLAHVARDVVRAYIAFCPEGNRQTAPAGPEGRGAGDRAADRTTAPRRRGGRSGFGAVVRTQVGVADTAGLNVEDGLDADRCSLAEGDDAAHFVRLGQSLSVRSRRGSS
ncbi:MAG TPA: S8 family serine peptidase [Actinophytocola sp.]